MASDVSYGGALRFRNGPPAEANFDEKWRLRLTVSKILLKKKYWQLPL